jgi:type IV secretory pathway TrbL component
VNKVFRTMIVTAAIAPTARQLAEAVPAGLGMFVAAYSPTGVAPATHFVSEGWIEEQFAIALESPEALVAMLAAVGVTMTLTDAQGLLSQATVSPLSATEVLAEMGLLPVGGEV